LVWSCTAAATLPASAQQRPDSTAAPQSSGADSTLTPATPSAPDSAGAAASGSALTSRLERAGLENLTVEVDPSTRVRFENRRYRHTTEALGTIERLAARPALAFEQRLGLTSAAIESHDRFRLSYPSDRGFPVPPAGAVTASTRRKLDILLDPLFTYSLGGILDQVMTRWELQAELRYNPWAGGRLRAATIFPIHDDFQFPDPNHPDVDKIRPGPLLLDQYAWVPGVALVSGTAGALGDNRYGLSLGAARPMRQGEILLDVQSDWTGYMAFEDSGFVYSAPNRWTGFADLTYRPPGLDLGIRLRAARYLHGDNGLELELSRAMGDLDVAMFVQRIQGQNLGGVRFGIPLPPMLRPIWPVRVLPVERIAFDYREENDPVGETVKNIGSREEFLRHLNRPALDANRYRYEQTLTGPRHPLEPHSPQWVSLSGMTGFINTPWAGVMRDREFEFGYNYIPKEAAYAYRGEHPNEVYYGALGLLPHVEVGLRWTVMPGAHPWRYLVPESPYVDADRMFSGRVELLPPRDRRPGFALGAEDVRGTKRFHSTYGVAGMPFDIYRLQSRVTIGYAPRVFTASGRTLDGLFGAYEFTVRQTVAAALEYDTEKWNSMLGINLGFGIRARVALLDLEHLSFGAGWYRAL
jgi:hypothetical protein